MLPPLHPACAAFPALPDSELQDLAADIRQNGLLDPVTMLDGLLLDGRCRWLACELAGIAPDSVEFSGASPFIFVLSKNRHRRHLTKSQKAMAVARLAKLQHGTNRYMAKVDVLAENIYTSDKLAEQSGLPRSGVQYGRTVLAKALPHIVDMVDKGEVHVRVAAEAVRNTAQAMQTEWTKADVEREGRAVINAYPSNHDRKRKAAKPKAAPKPQRRAQYINPPYGKLTVPTPEETGAPPPGSSLDEIAAHQAKYGRVQLFPKRTKELLDSQVLAASFTSAVLSLANGHQPEAAAVRAAIDDMLAHPEFARAGRAMLANLERALPIALGRLTALVAALGERHTEEARSAE